jgi:hypothetical protein
MWTSSGSAVCSRPSNEYGKAKSVHEAKAEFKINFEDGSSATLRLADPGLDTDNGEIR